MGSIRLIDRGRYNPLSLNCQSINLLSRQQHGREECDDKTYRDPPLIQEALVTGCTAVSVELAYFDAVTGGLPSSRHRHGRWAG